jgi:hypothetical protein
LFFAAYRLLEIPNQPKVMVSVQVTGAHSEFQAAHVVMLLYDLSLEQPQRTDQIEESLTILKENHVNRHVRRKGKTLALVGTHRDLLPPLEAKARGRLALKHVSGNAKAITVFGEVSAHSGDGVVDVFKEVVIKSLGGVKRIATIDSLGWSRQVQATTLEGVFVKREYGACPHVSTSTLLTGCAM